MEHIRKASIAIALGLMLSLTVFTSGVFAQSVTADRSAGGSAKNAAAMPTVQQIVNSALQNTKTQRATQPQSDRLSNGCGWWYGYHRCRRFSFFRCYRVFRGGWWGDGWQGNGWWGRRSFLICRRVWW